MTIEYWVDHLIIANQSTIQYLPMELLSGSQTSRILRRFPEKANDSSINWGKLDGYDWGRLLLERPVTKTMVKYEK